MATETVFQRKLDHTGVPGIEFQRVISATLSFILPFPWSPIKSGTRAWVPKFSRDSRLSFLYLRNVRRSACS